MGTTETAAATASVFAGLLVGSQIGDHVVQSNAVALAKAIPSDDQLAAGANPWSGWHACLTHVATYTLTQAVTLALVAIVAPLTWFGAAAALATSASTHAVIDRRWIVQAIIRAKGAADWPEGPYHVDQALHYGVLLIAAVLAATVNATRELAAVLALCLVLVVAALCVERIRARSAACRIGDPTRL